MNPQYVNLLLVSFPASLGKQSIQMTVFCLLELIKVINELSTTGLPLFGYSMDQWPYLWSLPTVLGPVLDPGNTHIMIFNYGSVLWIPPKQLRHSLGGAANGLKEAQSPTRLIRVAFRNR